MTDGSYFCPSLLSTQTWEKSEPSTDASLRQLGHGPRRWHGAHSRLPCPEAPHAAASTAKSVALPEKHHHEIRADQMHEGADQLQDEIDLLQDGADQL